MCALRPQFCLAVVGSTIERITLKQLPRKKHYIILKHTNLIKQKESLLLMSLHHEKSEVNITGSKQPERETETQPGFYSFFQLLLFPVIWLQFLPLQIEFFHFLRVPANSPKLTPHTHHLGT